MRRTTVPMNLHIGDANNHIQPIVFEFFFSFVTVCLRSSAVCEKNTPVVDSVNDAVKRSTVRHCKKEKCSQFSKVSLGESRRPLREDGGRVVQ